MMPENPDRSSSGRKKRPRSEEVEEHLDNTVRNANQKKRKKKKKRRRIQNPNFLPQPPSSSSPSMVLVNGLPEGCSVMALKSRFEMYGPISRTRIDGSKGFITYRSREAANSAVSASSDQIIFDSQKVRVSHHQQATETRSALSKLLRSEIPLSKYGKSNKKLSSSSPMSPTATNMLSRITRKIIVYDDLL